MTHILRIDEMAVRFKDVIDGANASKKTRIKDAQTYVKQILQKILKYKDDMVDALDTLDYLEKQHVNRMVKFNPSSPIKFDSDLKNNVRIIRLVYDAFPLIPKENHEEAYIIFKRYKDGNGGNLYCRYRGDDGTTDVSVEDIIDNSSTDTSNEVYFTMKDYYSSDDVCDITCETLIRNLKMFADSIEPFLNNFFNQVQNLK